jgi:class 3 adenylate cyclase/tetratricopeptide (TPR) repeat protein
MANTGTATLLVTDLVNSTELLSRAGDERAQLIFRGHHKLLSNAVGAHGGHEVKWLGDGLMAAFPSSSDAVRCAIAMQQSARRPLAGARLGIRVGLHVGEALREEADYFGIAVVVARRLCERAAAGQIIASSLVSGLLAGRQNFSFRDLGALELKGLAAPVPACEVIYEHDEPRAILRQMPFVGRASQMALLEHKLADARAGRGGLVMVVGEPGIGKTRTLEEFAANSRAHGALVVWGRCYEGEWAPPYGSFAEAIAEYVRAADAGHLRRELDYGGPPLARLVPAIRERIPDIGQPTPLQPEEERFRLLDAVSQLLIAVSARTPLVLVLDDLHWADRGTIAMLRHVARFIARNRILVIGAYRDVELDRQHPLSDALAALRREAEYERINLKGLDSREVGELLQTVADQDVPEVLIKAIDTETEGNPFFIREVLLHLIEEGKIFRQDGRWTSNLATGELGIPEGVRQVIGRRLSRLSDEANRVLAAASAFNGAFHFGIAAKVAGLDEGAALKAVDAALDAQLIRAGTEADGYDFTHALIRHTLYGEMNPSRQVRTHRQIAEETEKFWGARVDEHAAQIVYQFSRSAALPGAERGGVHAIAAADRAEATYAHDEVAAFLRIALELLPQTDTRRPRVLGRLGLALAWMLESEEALKIAGQAGDLIAAAEGNAAAADYLAEATEAMGEAGFFRQAGALAVQGLRYTGERRDGTWAILTARDLTREESENPDYMGLPLDSPRRQELYEFLRNRRADAMHFFGLMAFRSRDEVLAAATADSIESTSLPWALTFTAGDYRRALPLWQEQADRSETQGRIAVAVEGWAQAARCHIALGDLAAARAAYQKGRTAGARLTTTSTQVIQLLTARDEMGLALDENWEKAIAPYESGAEEGVEVTWFLAAFQAARARIYAHLGREQQALEQLNMVIAPLERAPGSAPNYTRTGCDAASTLWMLGRTNHIEAIEQNLREKTIAPDFRYPMQDARLSLARLCALQRRYEEAVEWFAKARAVLEEQGARPLRVIADFDEAWMYLRRSAPGDQERARVLLDAAIVQFKTIGMTGWLRRAEGLALAAS